MHDLKKKPKSGAKTRSNRRKRQRQKLDWRRLLHRALRVSVTLFSLTLIVVSSFLMVQLLMVSDLFKLDEVVVGGNQRLASEQVVALSDIRTGINTFTLDLRLIGQKIEENPWIEKAMVRRIFPRKIEIRISERKPVAIINLDYLYYLDEQGEIFKSLDSQDRLDYPVITGFDQQRARQHDQEYAQRLERIVRLLTDLQQRQQLSLAQVSEIHQEENGGLSLYTLKNGVRIKLGRTDFSRKLDRLERIYAQLSSKLHMLEYIDLNVEDKVIVRIERSPQASQS
jgi:cell division protein FtsQ